MSEKFVESLRDEYEVKLMEVWYKALVGFGVVCIVAVCVIEVLKGAM